jgi:hypothetical protein
MGKKKFEVGMRVRGASQAPARFRGRIGTVKDYRTYEGYGVEFDDKPDNVERVNPSWLDLEKRGSDRYRTDCFVVLEFHGHRLAGRCVDYSESGFGAIVDHSLPAGWTVFVELPMADGKLLRFEARIVYQNGSRRGFEFVTRDEAYRGLIMDFFRERIERT